MKEGRRSIRLRGYDYSQAGAYAVTICTGNRECVFGDVVDGEMGLNEYGEIVREEWLKTGQIRDEIELDEFVVMPNHFHGIVLFADNPSQWEYDHENPGHVPATPNERVRDRAPAHKFEQTRRRQG